VPGVAQAAIQEALYVGRLIAKKGAGGQTSIPLFRQGQHGGRRQELRGARAGLAAHGWCGHSFTASACRSCRTARAQQRQWIWSYFTGQRSSRLIPEPPRTILLNHLIAQRLLTELSRGVEKCLDGKVSRPLSDDRTNLAF
jgi:NADH:ubiquinone reductase (H+-translocating)